MKVEKSAVNSNGKSSPVTTQFRSIDACSVPSASSVLW